MVNKSMKKVRDLFFCLKKQGIELLFSMGVFCTSLSSFMVGAFQENSSYVLRLKEKIDHFDRVAHSFCISKKQKRKEAIAQLNSL
jgi:hypothetical protein